MVEVREVLRLRLKGHGYRRIAELVATDRKTVRRYVEAAQEAGLEREVGGGLRPPHRRPELEALRAGKPT